MLIAAAHIALDRAEPRLAALRWRAARLLRRLRGRRVLGPAGRIARR